MRKDSKKIIEIIVGIIFFLFFATGVGTMIWLIFSYPNEKIGLIASIISEVICLPASIASFLAAFALEKNYKASYHCIEFTDRKEIIKQIIQAVCDGSKFIAISGAPHSGVSELLSHISIMARKRKTLKKYVEDKNCRNQYRKKVGRFFYIDCSEYQSQLNSFQDELTQIFKLKRVRSSIILLDHLNSLEDPQRILDHINFNGGKKIITIYAIGSSYKKTSLKVEGFEKSDIDTLAKAYDLFLPDSVLEQILNYTWGNIGLLTLLFRNYNLVNVDDLNDFLKDEASSLIKRVLGNTGTQDVATCCSVINHCTRDFTLNTLSSIDINFSTEIVKRLAETGLFSIKDNFVRTNDMFSSVIRKIDPSLTAHYTKKISDHYKNNLQDDLAVIMLVSYPNLKDNDIKLIKKVLLQKLKLDREESLDYSLKLYNAYNENIYLKDNVKLDEIQAMILEMGVSALIFIGDYTKAEKILSNIHLSTDMLKYLHADLCQLRQNYNEAETTFSLLSKQAKEKNLRERAKLKISHCYKHIGRYTEAIELINDIDKDSLYSKRIKKKANIYSLNILIQSNDVPGLNTQLSKIEQNMEHLNNSELATYYRYKAVSLALSGQREDAFSAINHAINICEETHERVILNCYYIRGEIYRYFGMTSKAYDDLKKCYDSFSYNEDYNMFSMVVCSLILLENQEKILPLLSDLKTVENYCTSKQMEYNTRLLCQITLCLIEGKEFPNDLCHNVYIIP